MFLVLENVNNIIYSTKYLSNYVLFFSTTHIYIFDTQLKGIVVTSTYELPLSNLGQNDNSQKVISVSSYNNENFALFAYGNSFTFSKCVLPLPSDTNMNTLSCGLIYSNNEFKVNENDSYKIISIEFESNLLHIISFIRTDNSIMFLIYDRRTNSVSNDNFIHTTSKQNNINHLNCVNNENDKIICFTFNSFSVIYFGYKIKKKDGIYCLEQHKSETYLTFMISIFPIKRTSVIYNEDESVLCILTTTKTIVCINVKEMNHLDWEKEKAPFKTIMDNCYANSYKSTFGSVIRNEDSFFVYCISQNKEKLLVKIEDFDFDFESTQFSFFIPSDLNYINFIDFTGLLNKYLLIFCNNDSQCGIIGFDLITCFEDKMNTKSFSTDSNNNFIIDLYNYSLNQEYPINFSILDTLQIQINEITDSNNNIIDEDDINLSSSSNEFKYDNEYELKSFKMTVPIDNSLISFPITIKYFLTEEDLKLTTEECTLSLSNCYETCSSCTGAGTTDNHLCTTCIHNHYFSPDINTNCINEQPPRTYLDRATKSYKRCYTTCETCNQEGSILSHNCITCIPFFAHLIDDDSNCFLIYSSISGYYYSFTKGIFDKCDIACESCYNSKENNDTNCIECANGYFQYLYNPTHCIPSCEPNYWYFDYQEKTVKCTSIQECPSTYPILSQYSQNRCLDKCEENKYFYKNECIVNCPLGTLIDNVKMRCYDEPDSFTLENIEEMIFAFSNVTVLYGDNFIVQVYNSSLSSSADAFQLAIDKNLSIIDLHECIHVLKKVWAFNSSDDLVIMKIDLLQENQLTNKLEYMIFGPTEGNKLDLSVCSSLYIKTNYPLLYDNNNLNISINLDLAYNLSLMGYDVFDPEDPLFNDFCMNFTSDDGKDVTIQDRRNNYFQNISFCEQNCQYIQLLFNYNRVECACPIKQNSSSNNGYRNQNSFEEDIDHSNFEVVECYKFVFNTKIFCYNIGFYIFLMFSIIQLIVWIHYLHTRMKSILYKINEVLKSNPPVRKKYGDTKSHNSNNNNGLIIPRQHSNHYDYFEHNNNYRNDNSNHNIEHIYDNQIISTDNNLINNSTLHKHNNKLLPLKKLSKKTNKTSTKVTASTRMNSLKTNNTSINNFLNPLYSNRSNSSNNNDITNNCFIYNQPHKAHYTKNTSLHDSSEIIKTNIIDYEDMEYRIAIKKDKRSLIDIYWSYLKSKHIVFCLTCDHSFLFKFIRFAVFVLGYAIDCFFNALFFVDEHISKIYRIKDELSFWDELPISILSYVVSALFVYILEYLSSSKIQIKPKDGKTKSQFLRECNSLIKIVKCKLRFFFIIDLVFMCFFWYFVTAFCAVFQNSQMNWVKSCLFSLIFTLTIPLLTCLLSAILRVNALSLKLKWMFKVANFILLLI